MPAAKDLATLEALLSSATKIGGVNPIFDKNLKQMRASFVQACNGNAEHEDDDGGMRRRLREISADLQKQLPVRPEQQQPTKQNCKPPARRSSLIETMLVTDRLGRNRGRSCSEERKDDAQPPTASARARRPSLMQALGVEDEESRAPC